MSSPADLPSRRDDHSRFAPPGGSSKSPRPSPAAGDFPYRDPSSERSPYASWPTANGQAMAGGWGQAADLMPPLRADQVLSGPPDAERHHRVDHSLEPQRSLAWKILSFFGTVNAIGWVGFIGMAWAAYAMPETLSAFGGIYALASFAAAVWAGLSMLSRMRRPLNVFITNVILAVIFPLGPLGVLIAVNWLIAKGTRKQVIWGAGIAAAMTVFGLWQEVRRPLDSAMFTSTDDVTGTISRLSVTQYVVGALIIYGIAVGIGSLRRLHATTTRAVETAHQAVANVSLAQQSERAAKENSQEHEKTAQVLREHLSRQQEREQIAREMHDTVAHQLSLLSLQASALEVTSTDPTVPESAKAMRESVHKALDEMRGLITSLRDSGDGGYTGTVPTATDLDALIAEAKDSGANVVSQVTLHRTEVMPAPLATAMYRIVQEGLTNAIRYSSGLPIDARIIAAPGVGVHVSITNEISPTARLAYQGKSSHAGIPGMKERARAVGGSVSSAEISGVWFLNASLPWTEREVS